MENINLTKIERLLFERSMLKVSAECGVPARTLQRIKAGKGNPSLTTLKKLDEWARTKR